jgi:hypothetical protein
LNKIHGGIFVGQLISFPKTNSEQEVFKIEILVGWTDEPLICIEQIFDQSVNQ